MRTQREASEMWVLVSALQDIARGAKTGRASAPYSAETARLLARNGLRNAGREWSPKKKVALRREAGGRP